MEVYVRAGRVCRGCVARGSRVRHPRVHACEPRYWRLSASAEWCDSAECADEQMSCNTQIIQDQLFHKTFY